MTASLWRHHLAAMLLLALFLLMCGGCTRSQVSELAGGDPQVASAQQRATAAENAVAVAKGALVTAQAEAKAANAAKAVADHVAAIAPLVAILHVAEGLAVVAILLGVVEIIATLVWPALPITKTLGILMIASGAGTLLAAGLLTSALDHAHAILVWSAVALAIWGLVWLKRTGKLVAVLGIATDARTMALGTLRTLGHDLDADAVLAFQDTRAGIAKVEMWFQHLLGHRPAVVAPTPAPAPPPLAPTPNSKT